MRLPVVELSRHPGRDVVDSKQALAHYATVSVVAQARVQLCATPPGARSSSDAPSGGPSCALAKIPIRVLMSVEKAVSLSISSVTLLLLTRRVDAGGRGGAKCGGTARALMCGTYLCASGSGLCSAAYARGFGALQTTRRQWEEERGRLVA